MLRQMTARNLFAILLMTFALTECHGRRNGPGRRPNWLGRPHQNFHKHHPFKQGFKPNCPMSQFKKQAKELLNQALQNNEQNFENDISEKVDDKLAKADEILKIKLLVQPLEENQKSNKSLIEQNDQHIKTLIKFQISIDSHMQKNKDILDLINRFFGGFIVNVSQNELQPLLQEFVDKIKSIEKKLNVTQSIYEDFQKKLQQVQGENMEHQNMHLSHQQVLELFQEDVSKMKILFNGIIEEMKYLQKQYNGDSIDQKQIENDSQKQNQEETQLDKQDDKESEQIQDEKETQESEESSESEDLIDDDNKVTSVEDFSKRVQALEDLAKQHEAQLNQLLEKQKDLQQSQENQNSNINHMKSVENGLEDFINKNNESISNLLDHLGNMSQKEEFNPIQDNIDDFQQQLKEILQ